MLHTAVYRVCNLSDMCDILYLFPVTACPLFCYLVFVTHTHTHTLSPPLSLSLCIHVPVCMHSCVCVCVCLPVCVCMCCIAIWALAIKHDNTSHTLATRRTHTSGSCVMKELISLRRSVPQLDRTDLQHSVTVISLTGLQLTPLVISCLLYTSPSPRDCIVSRMPSSA